eukprot:TRINITY_DN6230_c0_g1_i3.p1 TRINITY_DN6230_c0_g1~~TRINITY_DN6230_c0_g1_i3.p1  ORF type:complete len:189 (-),score=27.63 TRINITY_DN6230_c0_g1_i3:232-798(-)
MTLLSGGGYAEYVNVHKDHVIRVPDSVKVEEAAAIPEAWITAYMITKTVGGISTGEDVFLYAGASGVGTAAIQLITKLFGGRAIALCSGDDKVAELKQLGANLVLDRSKNTNIVEEVKNFTNGKGVDLLLDCVGVSNYDKNCAMLKQDGRWILYGLMGGAKASNLNFGEFLGKRLSMISTTLRFVTTR